MKIQRLENLGISQSGDLHGRKIQQAKSTSEAEPNEDNNQNKIQENLDNSNIIFVELKYTTVVESATARLQGHSKN